MGPLCDWVRLRGWAVAVLLGLIVARPTLGQDRFNRPGPAPAPILGDGNEVLRWVLDQQQWQALSGWREAQADPSRTLLVILGDCGWSMGRPGLDPREIEQFVSSGGALLLASDRPHRADGTRELLALGVDIAGAFVIVPRGPLYREVSSWPLAVPIRHPAIPVFNQYNQVATNRPSFLRLRPGSPLQYVARFGPSAALEDNRRLLVSEYDGHFAAAGFIGKGKALVLADHSVFINSMLWQQDNQNLLFTVSALVWLREPAQPDQPKRTRCLLIDTGQIQPSFEVPIKAPSEPPPPPQPLDPAQLLAALLPHANELVRPVDQLIHDAQSPPNDPIGQADRFIAERISPPQRNLLLAATVVLVIVGAVWLFNSWRRTITQPGRIEATTTTKGWRALANVLPFLGLGFAVAVLTASLLYGGQLIRTLGPSGYGLSVLIGISLVVALLAWLARRPSDEITALAELAGSPSRKPKSAGPTNYLTDLHTEGNLLEPLARELRGRFARLGADPTQHTLPAVQIDLPWYKRWQLRDQLARLWAISQCQHARPIRPRDWTDIRALMTQLEAMAADGVWRFTTPQETT